MHHLKVDAARGINLRRFKQNNWWWKEKLVGAWRRGESGWEVDGWALVVARAALGFPV
jgi:hypothetical protein